MAPGVEARFLGLGWVEEEAEEEQAASPLNNDIKAETRQFNLPNLERVWRKGANCCWIGESSPPPLFLSEFMAAYRDSPCSTGSSNDGTRCEQTRAGCYVVRSFCFKMW